jgi:hypothetical protein
MPLLQVSRTYTFGRNGTHAGEGFDDHLGVMQLNTEPVDWKSMDLDYLLQDGYTQLLYGWMDKAEVCVDGSVCHRYREKKQPNSYYQHCHYW